MTNDIETAQYGGCPGPLAFQGQWSQTVGQAMLRSEWHPTLSAAGCTQCWLAFDGAH